MNRTLFFSAVAAALLLACSGATSSGDGTSDEADSELRASQACAGKSCGDSCSLCNGRPNCFETAELKQCGESGSCSSRPAVCGGGAVDAGPAPYQPCGGKSCGDTCRVCPPGDPSCFETAVVKLCQPDGACSASMPTCAPPAYDACGGKACGDRCTACPPSDPGCFETAVIKQCDAKGSCSASAPVCGSADAGKPPYDPCAGKACGASCTVCAPSDPNCFETAVLKQCNGAGACAASAPACP
jgi:hypothetical protein